MRIKVRLKGIWVALSAIAPMTTIAPEILRSKKSFLADLELRAEIQRLQSYERAEAHQYAAALWGTVHRGLTSIAAVSAAIAGTSLLTSATGGWRIAAGVLALMAAILSTLDTTLKAGQLAEDHKRGFDGFTQMRTKWVQFEHVTLRLKHSDRQLAEEFQRLVTERDQLSERVPTPPQWATKRVKIKEIPRREAGRESSLMTVAASAMPETYFAS